MTVFRMTFAGQIKKVDIKDAGGKALAEVSICKKNRGKPGTEETYTWCRVSIWTPPEWMMPRLQIGQMIAGSGEFTLRSYEKDGVKRQSAEINCQSFDVEVGGSDEPQQEQRPAPARRPAQAPMDEDSGPPF